MYMRTTLELSDSLVEAVKAKAKQEGRTFTSVVEEALRQLLARHAVSAGPVELPAYGDPNGRFLVDIADRDALWDALDRGEPR